MQTPPSDKILDFIKTLFFRLFASITLKYNATRKWAAIRRQAPLVWFRSESYLRGRLQPILPAVVGGTARVSLPRVGLFNKRSVNVLSAVAEQGVFAGTNFFVTILLGRWMTIDKFGAYSFGFSIFLFFVMLFEAFVSDPVPIVGSGKYASQFESYAGAVLYGHVAIATLVSLCLAGFAFLLSFNASTPLLCEAILGAAVGAPLLLLRPTTQQLCYTSSRNGVFVIAGLVYAIVAPALIYVLHISGCLRPVTVFVTLGFATAIPSLVVIFKWLRPQLHPRAVRPIMAQIATDHMGYGRWSCLSAAMLWFGSNVYYLAGPSIIGLGATGAIRAITNLILPIQMTNAAILSVLNPQLARLYHTGEQRKARRVIMMLASGLLIFSGGYVAALVYKGPQAIAFVYAGAFDIYITPSLIILLSLILLLSTLSGATELEMRVSGKIKWAAATRTLWALMNATLGIGACLWFGFVGVFTGLFFANAVLLAIRFWILFSRFTNEIVSAEAP